MDNTSSGSFFEATKKHASSGLFLLGGIFDFLSAGILFFMIVFDIIHDIRYWLTQDNSTDILYTVVFLILIVACFLSSALSLVGVFSARRFYLGKSRFNGLRIVYYSLYASATLFVITYLFYFWHKMSVPFIISTVFLFLLIFYCVSIFAKNINAIINPLKSMQPIKIKSAKIVLIAIDIILALAIVGLVIFYFYSFITTVLKMLDMTYFINYYGDYSTLGISLFVLRFPIVPKLISNLMYTALISSYDKDISKIQ